MQELKKNQIRMFNELGEVRMREYYPSEDSDYMYDFFLPFIHEILAHYYIFNYFEKTVLEFVDIDGYRQIVFDTLEEMRQYYIFCC